MTTVSVLGAGAWGTALASHAARLGHDVRLWALEPEVADEITARHSNSVYLPGVPLPETIRASSDVAEVVLFVPPSQHLRKVAAQVAAELGPSPVAVVATKGIEEESLKLMSEVLAETWPAVPPERIAFLSGPSFALEVARGKPTDVVVASRGIANARKIQALLH